MLCSSSFGKKIFLSFCCVYIYMAAAAQNAPADSIYLPQLNQRIDDAVVKQDLAFLAGIYAEDFVFSHGSGRVDGKTSWLGSVRKGGFIKREHDSVKVESHDQLAILRGRLNVQKKNKDKVDRYWLHYVRVYVYRHSSWKLVSHITTAEYHLPD